MSPRFSSQAHPITARFQSTSQHLRRSRWRQVEVEELIMFPPFRELSRISALPTARRNGVDQIHSDIHDLATGLSDAIALVRPLPDTHGADESGQRTHARAPYRCTYGRLLNRPQLWDGSPPASSPRLKACGRASRMFASAPSSATFALTKCKRRRRPRGMRTYATSSSSNTRREPGALVGGCQCPLCVSRWLQHFAQP